MNSQRRFRPSLEVLEDRCTPAAGVVVGSFNPVTGTWTLTGDEQDNQITINPTGTPNQFTVVGNNGTTVDGVMTASNVRNIVVVLADGDDSVKVNDTATLTTLRGTLRINGGNGANYAQVEDMTVNGNVAVVNGVNTTGVSQFQLIDSAVKGNVTVINGDGNTETKIYRSVAGVSYIGKNLSITNGVGADVVELNDCNVGGNVVVRNGLPDPANANPTHFQIFNINHTTSRSVIGGNLTVVNQGTAAGDLFHIWDVHVRGNVALSSADTSTMVRIDGVNVSLPVVINGNLNIKAAGTTEVNVGDFGALSTGLVVRKNLAITTGSGGDDVILYRLRVNGLTRISTGGGDDEISIDDCIFVGPPPSVNPWGFVLNTGGGADTVRIEQRAGTNSTTQFHRAVKIDMGAGSDTLHLGSAGNNARRVEFGAKAALIGGADTDDIHLGNFAMIFGSPFSENFENDV